MTISILIPTLNERAGLLAALLGSLTKQIDECNAWQEVEILTEMDNRQMSTGAKRNILLKRATGKYVIWIDDDDLVADYYVKELLMAAQSNPDCFAINGTYTVDGKNEIRWYLSKNHPNATVMLNGLNVFIRTTNHITCVKREIALKAGFPDKSNAEDKAYSEGILPYLKTERVIVPPMYWYRYSTKNKTYT